MTTKNRLLTAGTAVGLAVLAAAGIGYRVGGARAEGVPATQPLTYTGMLEESGIPVTGERFIFVSLWKDAASTDAASRACNTVTTSKTAVAAGWFTVDLDPTCTAAVNANPDLWVEVLVEGQPLPRTKLKAVPYALQAGHAMTVPWTGVTGVPAEVGGRRLTSASVGQDGTIVRQDGAWVAKVTWTPQERGAAWAMDFQPGAFSGVPTCVCNGGAYMSISVYYYACSVLSVSATGLTIATLQPNGSSGYFVAVQYPFDVVCTGPR